jgi:hypothetical protein
LLHSFRRRWIDTNSSRIFGAAKTTTGHREKNGGFSKSSCGAAGCRRRRNRFRWRTSLAEVPFLDYLLVKRDFIDAVQPPRRSTARKMVSFQTEFASRAARRRPWIMGLA